MFALQESEFEKMLVAIGKYEEWLETVSVRFSKIKTGARMFYIFSDSSLVALQVLKTFEKRELESFPIGQLEHAELNKSTLKVQYCRFENLTVRSGSYENNTLKILRS